MEDEAAIAQARASDEEGFRVLVERHSRNVFRLAFRNGCARASAGGVPFCGGRWR